MHPDIATILEDSLARVQTGASIASCLARYPEHAEELRPLLELATTVQALPQPVARTQAVAAAEQRMLAAVDQDRPRGVTLSGFSRYAERLIARIMGKEIPDMKLVLRFTMIALAVVLILGTGTVTAVSANALPGDALYSVKRSTENLRLFLTTNQEAQEQLLSEFQDIRRQEVQAVLADRRTVHVQFCGELGDLDNASWTVGGLRVLVPTGTDIVGEPVAGAMVEVQAVTQPDGSIVAQGLAVRGGETDPAAAPYPLPDDDEEDEQPGEPPRKQGGAQSTVEPAHQRQRDQDRIHEQSTAEPMGEQEHEREQEREQMRATAECTPEPEQEQERQRERQQATAEPSGNEEQATVEPTHEQERQQQATPQAGPDDDNGNDDHNGWGGDDSHDEDDDHGSPQTPQQDQGGSDDNGNGDTQGDQQAPSQPAQGSGDGGTSGDSGGNTSGRGQGGR